MLGEARPQFNQGYSEQYNSYGEQEAHELRRQLTGARHTIGVQADIIRRQGTTIEKLYARLSEAGLDEGPGIDE